MFNNIAFLLDVKLWQVAETLIKRVLAPPNQKTKLVEATEVCSFVCLSVKFQHIVNVSVSPTRGLDNGHSCRQNFFQKDEHTSIR